MENWVLFYLPGFALILFIFFKLINLLTWPWLWVLSPGWVVLLLIGTLVTVQHLGQCYWDSRLRRRFKIDSHTTEEN